MRIKIQQNQNPTHHLHEISSPSSEGKSRPSDSRGDAGMVHFSSCVIEVIMGVIENLVGRLHLYWRLCPSISISRWRWLQ